MVTRIDLLVHTTAPSSRNDDERYKAQAEAYSRFVAAGTFTRATGHGSADATGGLLSSSPGDRIGANANMIAEMRQTTDQRDREPSEVFYDPTMFLDETQLGYTALESQIFKTSSRTPKKLLKRALPIEQQIVEDKTIGLEEIEKHASTHDESSSSHRVPSQSSYLMSPVLDRSSKKARINEANRQYFQSSRSLVLPNGPVQEDGHPFLSSAGPAPTLKHTAPGSQQNSFSGDDITSELPTSYSLSDMSPESYRNRQQSIQRSISDPGPPLLEPTAPEREEQRRSESPQESPHRLATQNQTEANLPEGPNHEASSRYSGSETAAKDFAQAVNVGNLIKDTPVKIAETQIPSTHVDLPTTIRAPAPEPSLQPFKTHITESLKYLSENASLAQSYKPIFVSRDLEQSERGCWAFDIASWPAQLRTEFFQFLAKMIKPGRVGWGVWCTREPCESLRVRVFCWGEVVEHIYLMLYVASKSKVRKLGLKWIDAEGEVVVQMRGEDGNEGKAR